MGTRLNLSEMATLITKLREMVTSLKEQGNIPTVIKNCERILASIYMLEINVNDVLSILNEVDIPHSSSLEQV